VYNKTIKEKKGENKTMTQPIIRTVDQVNQAIKKTLEGHAAFQDIWIKGEISNFTHHGSGHLYFNIKENGSAIKAVMFKGSVSSLNFKPQNGTKVIIRGGVTVYKPSGNYQINVKEMQPDGMGSLYLALEQLKEKLEKEGLFRPERKRPLPTFPKVIGIVTSPTGAAVQDMITTIRRRFPIAKIQLFPVIVQGDSAPASIIQGIEKINEKQDADVLIVGRGGGSIEDLWGFNDENVARAIYSSAIPVISAVGHETDFTIADFVADHRAPTPTAAAELATPHTIDELTRTLQTLQTRSHQFIQNKLHFLQEKMKQNQKILEFYHPKKQLEQAMQQLDLTTERLTTLTKQKISEKKSEFQLVHQRLQSSSPKKQISSLQEKMKNVEKRLILSMNKQQQTKQNELSVLMSKLDALSPLKTLHRGFSVAYKEENVLKSAQQVNIHDKIKVKLTDATLTCSVEDIKEEK